MFRDFACHTAWVTSRKTGRGYCGLIEYQPKYCGAQANLLQATAIDCLCEDDALSGASNLLEQLQDITVEGRLVPKENSS